ncbi:MAG: hypothetical protein EXR65_02265 [Dehalococcoidia bacterium]|nr:hypothetical protein [Dehalococcoidia bacterium]
MAEQARFAAGHEHGEECAALYREWKRYHTVVQDTGGRFTRPQVLEALRERDKYEAQLRRLGCSGEALRRLERDAEIAEHGRPLL